MNNRLKQVITEKGLRHDYLAKLIGVTPSTFSRKVNGTSKFNTSEIYTLTSELELDTKLSNECFFSQLS